MSTIASLAVRLGLDNSDLQKGLQQSEGMVNKFGSAIGGLAGKVAVAGFAAAGAAAVTMAAALKNGVEEASQMQEAMAQVSARIKSTGGSAGVTSSSITSLANAMQSQTRFSDDAVVAASSLALTFTNIKSDIFPDVIRLSADMATGMKTDLNSAILQVGKAMQDPISGATALRKAGVMLTDSQEELIKSLVSSGNGMQAQKIILQELATEFEGSAKAAGGTFAGQMDILNNKIGDLMENFGTILMPGLQAVADGIIKLFGDPAVTGSVDTLGGIIEDSLLRTLFDLSDWLTGQAMSDIKGFVTEVQSAATSIQTFLAPLLQLYDNLMGIAKNGGLVGMMWGAATGGNMFPDLAESMGGAVGATGMGGAGVAGASTVAAAVAKKSSYQQYLDDKALRNMAPDWAGRLALSGAGRAGAALTPGGYNFSMPDAGGKNTADAALSFQELLAKAFPSVGAAQGWMGAYSSAHGGAQASATDLRDKMAGDMFAQKYGRAATEDEWKQRYYKGSFEGVEEGGLDETFGKPGTWTTLIAEKAKQEASETQKLIDAFKAETDKVLTVQFANQRVTD